MKLTVKYFLIKKFFTSESHEPKKNTPYIPSEEGFVLLTSVMIMIAVALLGLAATNTAMFEMQIAGNEKFAQEQFFLADSGVNTLLADSAPGKPGRPIHHYVATPLPTCTNPGTHLSYYLPLSLPGDRFYYLERIKKTPFLAKILVCATRGNTIASLTVGIEFGLSAGGRGSTNDVGYNQ